jgi:hypothetical protein
MSMTGKRLGRFRGIYRGGCFPCLARDESILGVGTGCMGILPSREPLLPWEKFLNPKTK